MPDAAGAGVFRRIARGKPGSISDTCGGKFAALSSEHDAGAEAYIVHCGARGRRKGSRHIARYDRSKCVDGGRFASLRSGEWNVQIELYAATDFDAGQKVRGQLMADDARVGLGLSRINVVDAQDERSVSIAEHDGTACAKIARNVRARHGERAVPGRCRLEAVERGGGLSKSHGRHDRHGRSANECSGPSEGHN